MCFCWLLLVQVTSHLSECRHVCVCVCVCMLIARTGDVTPDTCVCVCWLLVQVTSKPLMLTILVKTIANTFPRFYIQQRSFFRGHLLTKLREWLLPRNGKIIVNSDMMLMSKNCSSMLWYKTTLIAFTLWVTVMLLLTDFTSAPDDKSIGLECCQKICDKVLPILLPILKKCCRYYW